MRCQCPMVVVGNKCDLPDRAVSLQEGEDFTAVRHALGHALAADTGQKNMPGATHVEASAKTGKNADLVFHTLIRKIEKGDKQHHHGSDEEMKKKPSPAKAGGSHSHGGGGGCILL